MSKYIFQSNKIKYEIDKKLSSVLSKNINVIRLTLPAVPLTLSAVDIAVVNYMGAMYPKFRIKKLFTLCENKGSKSYWIIDNDEYLAIGKKVINNQKFIKKARKNFKTATANLEKLVKKLEKNGIDENNLSDSFSKYLDIYMKQFAASYILTGPITFGFSDYFTHKFLKKYNYSDLAYKAIEKFSKTDHNFVKEEQDNLAKIAVLIKKQKIKNLKEIGKNKRISGLLEKHQENYYWIYNNYQHVRYLPVETFMKRSILLKDKIIKNEGHKERVNFSKINKKDIETLKYLGIFSSIQDVRKKYNLISNYWMIEHLKKISEKNGNIGVGLLKFASLSEIMGLLETGKINKKEISKRFAGCAVVNINNIEYWLHGKNYKTVKEKLEKNIEAHKGGYLKGIIASQGVVRGVAKIIINPKEDWKKLKKGDILVTSMTRPDFVPLLGKASAIITDEGGMTSHAAVISREMGIPCIIGTKIATSILKDGDLVEVDANKGIVKILK
jgi:phosphohistidine swiveling domain-containing protein